jgi:hypothetical protein
LVCFVKAGQHSSNCTDITFLRAKEMTTLLSTIPIKLIKERYSCVLDPTLALSDYGLPLVKQLGEVIDLWVARELWHILDNIHFYLQQPELLIFRKDTYEKARDIRYPSQQEIIRVLKQWEYARTETDLAGLRLFWVKDKLGESLLPSGINLDIIRHYEFLARSLNSQIEQHLDTGETLTSAFRDTVALTAALGSSFILTHQLPRDTVENSPPGICVALESWGIACQAIDPLDKIATIERDYLRHMIVQAGLSKHIWAGLHPSVVHLWVPASDNFWSASARSQESLFSEVKNFVERPKSDINLWEKAQGFWYQL